MSARAAARLESLGFTQVYRYKAGQADWLANGWPSEGSEPQVAWASQAARTDVPICHIGESVGVVRQRVQAVGWDTCVVVDHERVVLGLLRGDALQNGAGTSVEAAMELGPRTYRLNASRESITDYMRRHQTDRVLVTDADGKLVGMILQNGDALS